MKINFTLSDGKYSFSDALNLDDDHGLSDVEIESMKQARFNNWLAIILAPPPEEVLPPDIGG